MNESLSIVAGEPVQPAVKPLGSELSQQALCLPPGWTCPDISRLVGVPLMPYRARSYAAETAEDLAVYLSRHGGPEAEVYVDSKAEKITLILDAGAGGENGRMKDLGTLKVEKDPRFVEWVERCQRVMSAETLREMLEDCASHFETPTAAEIRTLVNGLRLKKSQTFSKVEHDGAAAGVSLEYKSEIAGASGGAIEFPEVLVLSLPVYRHQTRAKIPVKVKIDLQDGTLYFKLRIPDLAALLEAAWGQVAQEVHDALTEVTFGEDGTETVPIFCGVSPV